MDEDPVLTAWIVKLYSSIISLSSTLLTVIVPLLLSILNESVKNTRKMKYVA